jgi:hypothetical protein
MSQPGVVERVSRIWLCISDVIETVEVEAAAQP